MDNTKKAFLDEPDFNRLPVCVKMLYYISASPSNGIHNLVLPIVESTKNPNTRRVTENAMGILDLFQPKERLKPAPNPSLTQKAFADRKFYEASGKMKESKQGIY